MGKSDEEKQKPRQKLTRRDWLVGTAKYGTVAAASGAAAFVAGRFSSKDTRRRPEQQEADRIYADIHQYLTDKKAEADEAGKPLAIIIGDTHADNGRNPLMIQMITLEVANDMGIKIFAPELDDQRLKKLFRDEEKGEIADTPNFKYAIQAARKKNFRVIPVDTFVANEIKSGAVSQETVDSDPMFFSKHINERNIEMTKHIARCKDGAVAMIGDLHMQGIIEGDLKKTHTIAALSCLEMDKDAKFLAKSGMSHIMIDSEKAKAFDYLYESPKIHRIDVKGKIEDSRPGTTADMVKKAREHFLDGQAR
jgi:hypothetical protein